jgi:hypothetical protein
MISLGGGGTLSDVGRWPTAHVHRVPIFVHSHDYSGVSYEREQTEYNVPDKDAADLHPVAFGLAGKPRDIHAPFQKPPSEIFKMNHQRFSHPFNPFFSCSSS